MTSYKFKEALLIHGYIELQGGLGEFVCRLLLILARDAAVQINLPQPSDDPENELKETAISVSELLSQLIDCKNMVKLFDPYPMSSDWLLSGRINISHIDTIEVPFTGAIDAELLWNWWKRGLAIQCVHNQPGIDGIIPVYVGNLEDRLCPAMKNPSLAETDKDASRRMTYIGWQAKNRSRGVSILEGVQGPKVIGGYQSTALFTILLELGTETPLKNAPSRESPYYSLFTLKIPNDTREGEEGTMQPIKKKRKRQSGATCRNTSFPILRIRGVQQAFPCLDKWDCRSIVSKMLGTERPLEGMELTLDIRMGIHKRSPNNVIIPVENVDEDVEMGD